MGSRGGRFLVPACAAAAVCSSLSLYAGGQDGAPVQSLYGAYCVVDVEKYRGGLTNQEQALSRLHETVMFRERDFVFWDGTRYHDPLYRIEDHPISAQEGHIPDVSQQFGAFYGYGLERDNVTTLSVHEFSDQPPPYVFEITGNQLWLFLDGWFYKFEKALSGNARTCSHMAT